jgi:hypothetical protein
LRTSYVPLCVQCLAAVPCDCVLCVCVCVSQLPVVCSPGLPVCVFTTTAGCTDDHGPVFRTGETLGNICAAQRRRHRSPVQHKHNIFSKVRTVRDKWHPAMDVAANVGSRGGPAARSILRGLARMGGRGGGGGSYASAVVTEWSRSPPALHPFPACPGQPLCPSPGSIGPGGCLFMFSLACRAGTEAFGVPPCPLVALVGLCVLSPASGMGRIRGPVFNNAVISCASHPPPTCPSLFDCSLICLTTG